MFKRVSALVVLLCLFQGYYSDEREDFTETYLPILAELSANFSATYSVASTESKLLETQIKNTTINTMSLIESQIKTLKTGIATAQNMSADNPNALTCLKVQKTAADALTAASINTTCIINIDVTDLTASVADFLALSKIPNATISACTTLNPLIPSQDDLFKDCVTDKVLDLEEQLKYVHDNFETVRTDTLDANVNCIAQASALIGQKISEINYQVTLCLTLN